MKKVQAITFSLLFLLAVSPMPIKAETVLPSGTPEAAMESARAAELLKRLDEINEMDKSAMTRTEKKEARKEVRAINKELKTLGSGVYISVGAIIIILLLLIILL
jgi:hypothetical protein